MKNPRPDAREMPPLTPWRRLRRDILTWPQRVTASQRVLPNLILLGAQRAGTTSLYAHMGMHPGICLSRTKEVHYFDNYQDQGLDWYRSNFPTKSWVERRSRNLGYDIAIGEGSPYYLFHPTVPERVHEVLPDTRLVVLLRDPIERALSHFRHERRNGSETVSDFETAWELETERLSGAEERLSSGDTVYDEAHNRFSYTARGDYAPQLERWLAKFDHSQLHIIRSEDLFEKPREVMSDFFDFLELPQVDLGDFPVLNATTVQASDPAEKELRKRLAAHFAPKVAQLEKLLGRSMGWTESWTLSDD